MEFEDEEVDEQIRTLLSQGSLTQLHMGAYLGFDNTPEASARCEHRAIRLLQTLKFLPTPEDVVFCESGLSDALGNPIMGADGNQELCGLIMTVNRDRTRRLGFRWRCLGKHRLNGAIDANRNHGDVRVSPLLGHMFENAHSKCKDFLKILIVLTTSGKIKDCKDMGLSRPTSICWFRMIKEALAIAVWHDQKKIGGYGDVVELDEVLLVKRKYNRGRIPIGHYWVFGGLSRVTKKRFAMRVGRRDRGTLNAEIIDNVLDGSIICSDGWAAYNQIRRLINNGRRRYRDHLVVNHTTNFIDPPRHLDPYWRNDVHHECRDKQHDGPVPPQLANAFPRFLPFRAHTQSIERSWIELKKKVESKTDLEYVDRSIGYYLYRENVLKSVDTQVGQMRRILEDLGRVYSGPNVVPI